MCQDRRPGLPEGRVLAWSAGWAGLGARSHDSCPPADISFRDSIFSWLVSLTVGRTSGCPGVTVQPFAAFSAAPLLHAQGSGCLPSPPSLYTIMTDIRSHKFYKP